MAGRSGTIIVDSQSILVKPAAVKAQITFDETERQTYPTPPASLPSSNAPSTIDIQSSPKSTQPEAKTRRFYGLVELDAKRLG